MYPPSLLGSGHWILEREGPINLARGLRFGSTVRGGTQIFGRLFSYWMSSQNSFLWCFERVCSKHSYFYFSDRTSFWATVNDLINAHSQTNASYLKFRLSSPSKAIFKKRNQGIGESEKEGTGNGERGTGNGERGTGNGERGTGNGERGTGNRERRGIFKNGNLFKSGNPKNGEPLKRKILKWGTFKYLEEKDTVC